MLQHRQDVTGPGGDIVKDAMAPVEVRPFTPPVPGANEPARAAVGFVQAARADQRAISGYRS